MSYRIKITTLFVALIIVPVVLVSLVSVATTKTLLTNQARESVSAIANVKAAELKIFIKAEKDRVLGITSRTKLRELLLQYNDSADPTLPDQMKRILVDAASAYGDVKWITLADKEGRVVTVTREISSQEQLDVDLVTSRVVEDIEIYFDRVLGDIIVVGPIYRDDQLLGYVSLRLESLFLDNLLSDYTGLGETGEVLLAARDDMGDAEFLHNRRFEDDTNARAVIDKRDTNVPITRALRGEENSFVRSIDYRGQVVIAATRYLPEPDWGIVVKIDQQELEAKAANFQTTLFVLAIIITLFSLIVAYVIARSIVMPIEYLTEKAIDIGKGVNTVKIDKSHPVYTQKDEIGVLAMAFYSMIESLKSFSRGLEDKIQERTRDLKKFQQAVDSATDGIVITDTEHEIIYTNRAWEKMTGYVSQDAIGKTPKILQSGQTPRDVYEEMYQRLGEGESFHSEAFINKRKNGTTYNAEISIYPIKDNEETIFFVGLEQDVTQRKNIDKAKSDFVSVASHQLRTPITGIQWTIERFMKKEKMSKRGKEYLSDMHRSLITLAELVDSLLNVSRIESGGVSVTPTEIDLVVFIKEYLAELKSIEEKKELKLVFKKHPKTLKILSDKNVLRNVVQSIVSNAVEYTPEGGTVEVSIEAGADEFLLKVRDTGIGIPLEDQATIFEKFHRAENARLVKTDGSGLGLYVAKKAIDMLGGKVLIRSKVNKGTTFYVNLPLECTAKEGKKTLL